MNSFELSFLKTALSKQVAKTAKIELYGLHYKTDWFVLMVRNMVLKALQYNIDCPVEIGQSEEENVYFYTDEQIKCMLSRSNKLSNSKLKVKTSDNNCCN